MCEHMVFNCRACIVSNHPLFTVDSRRHKYQFYVFGMYSIISFRTLSEYMPSSVFFKFREDGYPGFERDADVLIHL